MDADNYVYYCKICKKIAPTEQSCNCINRKNMKICKECKKNFIPEKPYYHTCTDCFDVYSEYNASESDIY